MLIERETSSCNKSAIEQIKLSLISEGGVYLDAAAFNSLKSFTHSN